jgi:hypothetical protein
MYTIHMTLGPVGDTIGLTSTAIYVAAICQIPISLVLMVHFQPIRADFFATSTRIAMDYYTNTTGVDLSNPTYLHYMHSVNVSPLFLLCSALIAFFVATSVNMHKYDQHGMNIECEDFISTNENVVLNPVVTAWNHTFVCLLIASHALVVIVVITPTSIHCLGLILFLFYFSFSLVSQPRIQPVGSSDASSGNYIPAIVAYGAAMCFVVSNIVCDDESFKVELIVIVAFVDIAIVIMGHTWDPVPNMQTIINCRLLYCMFFIILNLSIYCIWASVFKMHLVPESHLHPGSGLHHKP